MLVQINRWPYLGEDYSIDSERLKALIGGLRRVGEVLKENKFLFGRSALEDRITMEWVGVVMGTEK